jgi:ABC-type multidrug transport system ATPase subunit/pSer/pThr/pTyr-binding forkhead associated (FHA) protein
MKGVVVTFTRDKVSLRKELSGPGMFRIGRTSATGGVEVSLPDDWSTISRNHCAISVGQNGFTIHDTGSANGTFVNGRRLAPHVPEEVQLSDKITLGSGQGEVLMQLAKGEVERESYTLISKLDRKDQITIGRSESCDIVLTDLRVSRSHAKVTKRNGKFFVEDLGSRNGTYLNDKRISGTVELKPDDTLFICLYAFKLEGLVRNLQSEPVIQAHGISKVYTNGNIGLFQTDLTVDRAEMVAIMGPSGSGKSTLLKLLNGEIAPSEGTLRIYGLDLVKYRGYLGSQMGYVPQDDIVHRELTVYDTLYFAARIRMKPDVSLEDIKAKIMEVLRILRMDDEKLMATRVGDLSGGQRKRVSIAVELLNEPKLLFLDEPTSPLDPETIDEFLKCLKRLAENGTTVLLVTHKPEDLSYVDRVVFIGTGGYHVYTEKPHDMPRYFNAGNIIDVYSIMSHPDKAAEWYTKWYKRRSEVKGTQAVEKEHSGRGESNHTLPQLYWQTLRYTKVKLSNSGNLMLILLQPVLIGLLVAVTFSSLRSDLKLPDESTLEAVADTGLLFLLCLASVWFGVSLSAKEIVGERSIYRSERKVRLTPLVYLLSKQIVLSAFLFIQLCLFMIVLGLTYGSDLTNVMHTLFFLFLLGTSAILFGLCLSAFARTPESVMSFLPLALMPQIILSGIVSPVHSTLMELLSYLTFGRWGTEGIARIQAYSEAGFDPLRNQLYHDDAMTWCDSLDANILSVGALAVVFAVATYVKLLSLDKSS